MDDAFGNWLAGFIDGEGCFLIQSPPNGFCGLRLEVRIDDAPILREIEERVGFGVVSVLTPRKGYYGVRWNVSRKADCVALIGLLERYPPRAKKARDYAIWREAVAEWGRMRPTGRGRVTNDWTRFNALAAELRTGRSLEAVAA